jgi:catalase
MYDAVYVPGGRQSVDKLKMDGDALHFVNEAFRHCKPIAATGEGVELLQASAIKGVQVAEPDGGLTVDQGVVTVRGTDLEAFANEWLAAIAQHRFWMREKKEQVPA